MLLPIGRIIWLRLPFSGVVVEIKKMTMMTILIGCSVFFSLSEELLLSSYHQWVLMLSTVSNLIQILNN